MQLSARRLLAMAAGGLAAVAASAGAASGLTWEELLAAGKKEGTVAIIGPVNPALRNYFTEQFPKDTGIRVTYEGLSANVNSTRIGLEAAAGRVTVDVLMSGSAELLNLYPKGFLAPIKPILLMPEVIDETKWEGGKLEFTDPERQYLLRTVSSVYGGIVVNTRHVPVDAIKTSADLLKPQWKGKIISSQTSSGSGGGFATNILYNMKEDYFNALYKGQAVRYVANSREVVEQVARGTYLLGFGTFPNEIEEFKKSGFPLEVVYTSDIPGYVSASNSTFKLIKNSPHPNAGAVFVNWAASRKVQQAMMALTLDSSLRVDVDQSQIPTYMVRKPGIKYLDQHQYEFYTDYRPKVMKQIEKIIGR